MLRPMLGALIVGASVFIGHILATRLSRRRAVLGDYIGLLEQASSRMRCTGENLAAVFSDNFAGFAFDASVSFAPQWEKMADLYRDVLNAADRRVLLDFARGLGASDIPAELRHFEWYEELLRERLDDARSACEKKAKLCRILPFSIGLVLTILLL